MKRVLLLTIMWFAAVAIAEAANPWQSSCIQPITVGQTINGTLTTGSCYYYFGTDTTQLYYEDVYSFSGTAGQQISISMSSAAVDAWLDLYDVNDTSATPLISDDDGGGGTNARIPRAGGYYTLPATGTYYISANTASANQTGPYTITVAEAANPWQSSCIQPITVGQTINGTLTTGSCYYYFGTDTTQLYYEDVYSFSGTAGQQISISMSSAAVDAWLDLYDVNDTSATPLISDDDGGGGTNARIPRAGGYYTLPATGTYYISANTASANQTGPYTITLAASTGGGAITTATEFYHPIFDHYFITAYQDEAANLAAGNLPPWVPTGKKFNVWTGPATNITNVWRFFSASFAPKSGHFYTNNPIEAQSLLTGNVWSLEASDAFYMMAAPAGTCAAGTIPLYRLYNNGQGGAPNHRYTIDPAMRSSMIAANWIPEGNGADGVFACVPP